VRGAAERGVAAGIRLGASALRCGVLLAAVLLLAGCASTSTGGEGVDEAPGVDGTAGSPRVSDSANDPVTGSGHLTSRQLSLSGVRTLLVGAGFVVRVAIGEPEAATIRMDDNVADLVEAEVSGDQLRLGLKPGASVRDATLSAEISVLHLDRLTASGASQVTLAAELAGDALELDASGASQITGPVRVGRLLAAGSGASTLALSGQAGYLDLRGAGTSALRLPELAVRDLEVVLSGASCAAVAVSDTLAASASGASMLYYQGGPRITRQQASGASSIAAGAPPGGRCSP